MNFTRTGIIMVVQICISFFQYIGTMDVPRPTSRVEIVAAMRRVRVSTSFIILYNIVSCFY